jgi:hypothetical protein
MGKILTGEMHVMNKEEGAGAGRVSCQIKMLTKMED